MAIYFVIYTVAIVLLAYLNRVKKWNELFGGKLNYSWWIISISILMYQQSSYSPMIISGLVHKHGINGLWFINSALLAAGLIPFIFARLWNNAQLITDNQFILLRFSGVGANILHLFRAFYVGMLIAAVLVGLMIISFTQLFASYFSIEYTHALYWVSGLVLLTVFKSSLKQQFFSDIFHSVVYIAMLILTVVFTYFYSEQTSTILETTNRTTTEISWAVLLTFIGVQWWSVNILDGGGADAQRYMNIKHTKDILKTALLPILANLVVQWMVVYVVLKTLSNTSYTGNGEDLLIVAATKFLPEYFRPLLLLGLFSAFISTIEAYLNWGSSFVSVDLVKTYIKPEIKGSKFVFIGYLITFLIAVLAVFFALYYNNLQAAVKFLFAIGAGVGPVLVLRWFWLRINAYTQLAAMLSSFIYSVLFDAVENKLPFSNLYEIGFDSYSIKIILVTVLVTCTWLLVMISTKKDSETALNHYLQTIRPYEVISRKNIVYAILFGLAVVSINTVVLVWLGGLF
jgi:solute:Na+ symporter, SSS family